MRIILVLFVWFIILSCNDESQERQENELQKNEEAVISSAFDLEPRFSELDSIQVLYFDDPYGDSLRYTRFFSFVNTGEKGILEEIKKHLQQPYTVKSAMDTCRSEGKIYLLAGGEPVKTLYFSTRCPGCCYTYFIKDGSYYYFELKNSTRGEISSLKKMAKNK